jgi:pSer/pThr/pTyr-binding forkhead associated (FHA) protein
MSAASIAPRTGFKFVLTVKSGPDKGSTYQLLPPRVTIGRGVDNNIALKDPRVSRHAVVIEFSPEEIIITDLSGRKSLHINGTPAESSAIKDGDMIRIGDTSAVFIVEALVLAPTPPSNVPMMQPHQGGDVLPFAQPGKPAMSPAFPGGDGFSPPPARPRPAPRAPGQGGSKMFYVVVLVLIGGAYYLFGTPSGAKKKESALLTQEQIEKDTKNSEDRIEKLSKRRAFKSEEEKTRFEEADRHYREGFRDYGKGQYGRAMKSFETAMAIDPSHELARRYYVLSQKRRDEEIAQLTLEGRRYKEKQMYSRCSAAFEKVLESMNNRDDAKYKQAEAIKRECDLLMDNRFN